MLTERGLSYFRSLTDPAKLQQVMRAFTAIGMIFLGAEAIAVMIPAFFSARDLHQDYLMARALRDGINPYLPVTSLWHHYFGDRIYNGGLKHPSPHPPLVIILLLPFSFLPPPLAGLMWLIMSVLAIIAAIQYIFTVNEKRKRYRLPTLALVAVGVAGRFDLLMGQVNSLLLALMSLVWFGVVRNRYLIAGIALGSASSLKFFGWPLWLVLICQRQWRLCTVAFGAFCAIQLGTLGIVGSEAVKTYYLTAVPRAYARWGEAISNNSAQSLLIRATRRYYYKWDEYERFQTIEDSAGTGAIGTPDPQDSKAPHTADSSSPTLQTETILQADPTSAQYEPPHTVDKPKTTPDTNPPDTNLARSSFILGMLVVLILALLATSHNQVTAFSRAVTLSCIASPLAWSHSFVPIILPMLLLLDANIDSSQPFNWSWLKNRQGAILIVLLAVLIIPFDLISWDILALFTTDRTKIGIVPWWVRAIHLIPTVAILAAAALLRIEKDGGNDARA